MQTIIRTCISIDVTPMHAGVIKNCKRAIKHFQFFKQLQNTLCINKNRRSRCEENNIASYVGASCVHAAEGGACRGSNMFRPCVVLLQRISADVRAPQEMVRYSHKDLQQFYSLRRVFE